LTAAPAAGYTAAMSFDPGDRLIVALDLPDAAAALALAARVGGAASWVKIGLELFVAEGPAVVAAARAAGYRVMLDLKLHDIPETVGRAMTRVAGLGRGARHGPRRRRSGDAGGGSGGHRRDPRRGSWP
jgi:orotidine-5'-phosphate decarboxylase